jgi:hypothetical protein
MEHREQAIKLGNHDLMVFNLDSYKGPISLPVSANNSGRIRMWTLFSRPTVPGQSGLMPSTLKRVGSWTIIHSKRVVLHTGR